MINGVEFVIDDVRKHSMVDFELILAPFDIPFPDIKENYVERTGGNGSIDLTEVYGKIFYKDRSWSLEFSCKDKMRFTEALDRFAAYIHGKTGKFTLWNDPTYYHFGRFSIDKYQTDKGTGKIVLSITSHPYKYKQIETIAIDSVSGSKFITYKNERMEVKPSFYSQNAINFKFNGNSYALNADTETIFPNVEFTYGDNIIEWIGTSPLVRVTYQEGTL